MSDLKSKVMTLLADLNSTGINVMHVRCNDSGDNKSLFHSCQAQGPRLWHEV
jgi:hypothetical protein